MSKELELTLTGRDAGGGLGRIPLAGIPIKAADAYLEKLVHKNFKVAICEQLEDPKFCRRSGSKTRDCQSCNSGNFDRK